MEFKTIVKIMVLVAAILGMLMGLFVAVNNKVQFEQCSFLRIQHNVIYEYELILDRCLILEDGEELTIDRYYKKHKFDGMVVRK